MRIKHQDYSNLLFLQDNPEAEFMEPDGIETVRNQSVNLDKQYSGSERDNLLIADNGIQSHGGQAISPKPDEETATIGDGNLGAGEAPIYSTYPYPPNPDRNLGVPENAVVTPKLQATGPPQETYGVKNSMSNSSNFGAVADNQLNAVVERVEEAIRQELMTPKDPMGLGEESTRIPVKQDGNEIVASDGRMIAPNGQAGDGVRQIPNIAEQMKSEEHGDDYHFPYIIAFDYNGTIDARGTGRGIPIQVLQDLQRRGKKVLVFTSSTKGADKEFMRQTLDKLSIPYTDDERVLTDVDMLIGDKKSDERRAGRYGVKFIDVTEFSMDKVLAKSVSIPGMNRTVMGDKWDGNVNDYREGGLLLIMNTPSQKDMLVQLLGARGFILNDLAEGLPTSRLEHKMGGSIATISASKDNQALEVSITDRTGRPVCIADDWAKLYVYLQQAFPKSE